MKRLFIGLTLLVAAGCKQNPAPEAAPSAAPAAPPVASVAAAVPDPVAASAAPVASAAPEAAPVAPAAVAAIPTEEDFEPQAATAITAANASQQLAALEKEIGK
jgi:hypothetical protein